MKYFIHVLDRLFQRLHLNFTSLFDCVTGERKLDLKVDGIKLRRSLLAEDLHDLFAVHITLSDCGSEGMCSVRICKYTVVAEVCAVDVRSHLAAALLDAFHQHDRVDGIAACADLRMCDLFHKPDNLICEQIAVVLDGNLQTIFFDSRNVALEIISDLSQLYHNRTAQAGMGTLVRMLNVCAVFNQCAAQLVCDLERFFDGAVYTRIRRCIGGDVQLQTDALFFCIFVAFCQIFIRCIILNINQCDVQNIQTDFNCDINEIEEILYLLECMMLAVLLESPALAESGKMKGVAVHAEFELSVLLL